MCIKKEAAFHAADPQSSRFQTFATNNGTLLLVHLGGVGGIQQDIKDLKIICASTYIYICIYIYTHIFIYCYA